MPVNYKNYHPDWKDVIRPAVLKRDNYRCRVCGVPNKARIVRTGDDGWLEVDPIIERNAKETGQNIVKVILTVAHLNHLVTDNRMENLKSMCQLHHIRHDAKHKAAMREVGNVWSIDKLFSMIDQEGGEKYLNHLFVMTRARRNQLKQLLQIREKRSKFGTYSQYDKGILRTIKASHSDYFRLVKKGCEILSKAYGIRDGARFFREYWDSDTKIIGGKKLGLAIPEK